MHIIYISCFIQVKPITLLEAEGSCMIGYIITSSIGEHARERSSNLTWLFFCGRVRRRSETVFWGESQKLHTTTYYPQGVCVLHQQAYW